VVGANPAARPRASQPLAGRANYLRGKNPERWRTDVANYARVEYADAYPGVDLVYYGNQRELEYDFVVKPGGDVRRIRLEFEGARAAT
jgi:hypothetical protein